MQNVIPGKKTAKNKVNKVEKVNYLVTLRLEKCHQRGYTIIMIVDFKNKATEDIYNGINSKQARKTLPVNLQRIAYRKLDSLNNAISTDDLRNVPGNHFEELSGDRAGQYSIRINNKYRICFEWTPKGAENVVIVDYH